MVQVDGMQTLAEINTTARTWPWDIYGFVRVWEGHRVGTWGVVEVTTRHGRRISRGMGGQRLHLMRVVVVEELCRDFDAAADCQQRTSSAEREELQKPWNVERRHGGKQHRCHALKVGDVLQADPVCRDSNVRGVGTYEPSLADTDAITCHNCLRGFFGLDVAVREEHLRRIEAATIQRPVEARCLVCDEPQKTRYMTEVGDGFRCTKCQALVATLQWNREVATKWEHEHQSSKHDGAPFDTCLEIVAQHRASASSAEKALARRQTKGDKARAARPSDAPVMIVRQRCTHCGQERKTAKTPGLCSDCAWLVHSMAVDRAEGFDRHLAKAAADLAARKDRYRG